MMQNSSSFYGTTLISYVTRNAGEKSYRLFFFIPRLLQGFHHFGRCFAGRGMNPGFDAQVNRHQAAEPEAAVDVTRHHVAGPVRAEVDARRADQDDERG